MSEKEANEPSNSVDPVGDAGASDPPLGDVSPIEAPKKPRSQKQIDAFARARAKRAENIVESLMSFWIGL